MATVETIVNRMVDRSEACDFNVAINVRTVIWKLYISDCNVISCYRSFFYLLSYR